ncbi:hypothetical protein BDZ91DRAFT_764520 [Kalaharituber pfeilii]|nr:hypothetical protein BDZ91DRAFT_764520 [Kalaharituber pfeilii]
MARKSKRLRTWYQPSLSREAGQDQSRRSLHNQEHDGNKHQMDWAYLRKGKELYGELVPAVCGPGDIRISNQKSCPATNKGRQSQKDGLSIREPGPRGKQCQALVNNTAAMRQADPTQGLIVVADALRIRKSLIIPDEIQI